MLVKTKRGVNAPLELKTGHSLRYAAGQRLPDFLGSYDYAQLYNEAMVNDLGPGLRCILLPIWRLIRMERINIGIRM